MFINNKTLRVVTTQRTCDRARLPVRAELRWSKCSTSLSASDVQHGRLEDVLWILKNKRILTVRVQLRAASLQMLPFQYWHQSWNNQSIYWLFLSIRKNNLQQFWQSINGFVHFLNKNAKNASSNVWICYLDKKKRSSITNHTGLWRRSIYSPFLTFYWTN